MQHKVEIIKELYKKWKGVDPHTLDLLQQSGSERRYFRLHGEQSTVIGTYGENIKENDTFIYFSRHFKNKGLAVPEIFAVSEDRKFYLQQDFGNISLLNRLEAEGYTQGIYDLFGKALGALAQLQVQGHKGLDYDMCLTNKVFGRQAIMADLLYFKYYFLDALRKPYDKQKLIDDFEALSNYLTHTEFKFFMFRDFQSRNIMVDSGNDVHFIDYQGGMKGAPQYDVASILWQAKANLSEEWKERLLDSYIDSFQQYVEGAVDRSIFKSQYYGYVLLRLLQVLGAYGFRGLFERKAHFLSSIPMALRNLKDFLEHHNVGIAVPEFKRVLGICISDEVIEQYTPVVATESTPLVVEVNSFSYKHGLPVDSSGNGGGFTFDCRGILNPGRLPEMKTKTGRDKDVKDYLEQQTLMPDFLNSVFDLIDISVENYIQRGFEHLQISFGCTGGQHRSVYAAEETARHLRNKYKVQVRLTHIEQEKKNWENG